jgi:Flavin-binding monooxygenase-like
MTPSTILVIGCGPAGMFFCHAMETRRQEMLAARQDVSGLPSVIALERASGPGGVWRAKRANGSNHAVEEKKEVDRDEEGEATNMYEGLWTNGPKEAIEFFDYTFEEHFGQALPVYMPRQPLLEYMLARVTRKCPDFFEKYARFNAGVQSVAWNEETKKFDVISKNLITGKLACEAFDKCIWSGGSNGRQKIPFSMVKMFREGGFTGRMIHSSDTSNFEQDVKGKRVLMIGGSYSSEDLALTAIKFGAAKIYISTRQENSFITSTSAWPDNKVDLLVGMQPVKVTGNGNSVHFAKVKRYHGEVFVVADAIETSIIDVDTVIFCTGFHSSLDMLSEELRKPFEVQQTPHSSILDVPKDWKMDDALLPDHLRDIEPGSCLWFCSYVMFPDLFKWTLIDNPNMMYIVGDFCEFPILASETIAWFLASICTGGHTLPSATEQRRLNKEQALYEMAKFPSCRIEMDSNFYDHVMSTWDDHPTDEQEKLWNDYNYDMESYALSIYAQIMRDGKYPLDIGGFDQLNETGKHLIRMDYLSGEHRCNLEENTRRTFRDYKDASEFKSIFTGTVAVPLKKGWMEIDDVNDLDIFKQE